MTLKVCDLLDSLPNQPRVVVREVAFNPLSVLCFRFPDSSLQVSSGSTVQFLVSRPVGSVAVFEECLDLAVHPGLLIWEHSDAFIHSYTPHTELDVG